MREDLINRVIDLQIKCNNMINAYGECDHETADEVIRLADSLTLDECSEFIKQYQQRLASR
jgi:uncharacterized membrane protein YjjP (DUF1212 family)